MFDSIKMYGAAIAAAVVGIFIAIFKYRGNKIEELEDAAEVVQEVTKAKNKVASFETENKVNAATAHQPIDYVVDSPEDPTVRFYNV